MQSEEEACEFYTGYYDQRATQGGSGVASATRTSRYWRVVETVPDLERVEKRVVDIGCGDGRLCGELRSAGWPSVMGVDVARGRVSRAKERHPELTFFEGGLESTNLRGAGVDLAIMDNVVEHLAAPVAVLRDVFACLRLGGRLVVITPNMESGQFRLLGRRWTPELAPHVHVFLFTDTSLRLLLADTGFTVEKTGHFQLSSYPWRFWLRVGSRSTIRDAAWRAMQAAGDLFARLIRCGPMLFAVARRNATVPEGSSG